MKKFVEQHPNFIQQAPRILERGGPKGQGFFIETSVADWLSEATTLPYKVNAAAAEKAEKILQLEIAAKNRTAAKT